MSLNYALLTSLFHTFGSYITDIDTIIFMFFCLTVFDIWMINSLYLSLWHRIINNVLYFPIFVPGSYIYSTDLPSRMFSFFVSISLIKYFNVPISSSVVVSFLPHQYKYFSRFLVPTVSVAQQDISVDHWFIYTPRCFPYNMFRSASFIMLLFVGTTICKMFSLSFHRLLI